MRTVIISIMLMTGMSLSVNAQTTFFTNQTDFEAASMDLVLNTFDNVVGLGGTDLDFGNGIFTASSPQPIFGANIAVSGTSIADGSDTFTFNLNDQTNAFGITILNFGTFGVGDGAVFSATASDGSSIELINTTELLPSGNQIFFGVVSDTAFSTVSFASTSSFLDVVGFDNLLTGNVLDAGGANPVAAIPEPATWLMMIIGFATVGLSVRNRRRVSMDLC